MIQSNKNFIAAMLCCALIVANIVAVPAKTLPVKTNNASQQIDAQAQDIKNQITKIGVGGDITIIGNNGREFYGSILKIEDETVSINEVDQKVVVEIKYRDIKKVRKNYGSARNRFGNRIRPRRKIIALAIVGSLLLLPIIILANSKD